MQSMRKLVKCFMLLSKLDWYFTTILFLLALCYCNVSSSGGKECDTAYPDTTADYAYTPTEGVGNGIDQTDLGYLVFDSECESPIDGDAPKEQPMSEESLRESLKKQLEFCFSR